MTKKYYRPSKYGLNEHTWRWNSYTVLKLTLINLWHLVRLLVYELPFSNQKKPSTDGLGPALCLFTPWSLPEIFLLGIILVYWIPFFLCNRFVSHIRLVLLNPDYHFCVILDIWILYLKNGFDFKILPWRF